MAGKANEANEAKKAKKLGGERVFEGRLLSVDLDRVIEPGASEPARREVVRHGGASAVVPCLPGGRIILVRQYRYAPDSWMWELPAGVLEPQEDPADCARRELAEETGYQAGSIESLAVINSSPGFCDEVIFLFRAGDLRAGTASPDPEENLEVKEFTITEAIDMIRRGQITDSKTVSGILLSALEICPVAGT